MATKTKVERIEPPKALLEVRATPTAPAAPEGEVTIQDVIEWYESWISELEQAHLQSEADKAAIRKWTEKE